MWVGFIQSIEDLHKARRLKERDASLPDCLSGGTPIFSFGLGFRLEPTPLALLLLRLSDSDWNYIMGPPGSPACGLQILGLLSPQNHMNRFLIRIFFSLYLFLSYWLCFFWIILTNIPTKYIRNVSVSSHGFSLNKVYASTCTQVVYFRR